MTVVPLRRTCQIVSCTNTGRLKVTVYLGGEPVTYWLCRAHSDEHRACGGLL